MLLLETIPGLRFRARRQHQDEEAALKFFRNVVEEHRAKSMGVFDERNIFTYPDPWHLYENSFAMVSADELEVESWTEPLGRGQNGAVYAARWNRAVKYLKTSDSGPLDVVLKDVIDPGCAYASSTKKFLEEVSLMTFN